MVGKPGMYRRLRWACSETRGLFRFCQRRAEWAGNDSETQIESLPPGKSVDVRGTLTSFYSFLVLTRNTCCTQQQHIDKSIQTFATFINSAVKQFENDQPTKYDRTR